MTSPMLTATRVSELLGPLADDRPAYRALADGLRLLVADGRIATGTRLPSERDLTTALRLSRTTVTRAYAVLRESGYVTARQGSGTVAALPTGRTRLGTGAALFPAEVPEHVIDLTCAATRAPAGTADAYERAVQSLPAYLAGAGYLTLGVPELRELIAARYTERGAPTTADQIVVTSGAVAGLAIATRALLGVGDRVLAESPGYPNASESLRRSGLRLSPVTVDPTGWDTATTTSTISAVKARAFVTIPDFHNPTGALMPDDQRAAFAHALKRARTTPIVDETMAELALDDRPLPKPFAAHHPGAVTVGSSSKSHWGGLRTGWIRAPHDVVPALLASRATLDLGAPVLEQLVLVELVKVAPGLTTDRRAELTAARDATSTALRTVLPDVRFVVPPGGLSLWLELPWARADEVAAAAQDEGLLIAGGPRFAVGGGLGRRLRLPYVLAPATMSEAVRRLGTAVERVREVESRSGGARHTTSRRRPAPLVA
jgi:DNA-binding transcriptional MocR family regulator